MPRPSHFILEYAFLLPALLLKHSYRVDPKFISLEQSLVAGQSQVFIAPSVPASLS